ncbi:DegV family protein [Rothia sp. LK2588]|uniref:DegV family protein n=1 Tax=Rothia sp. LK2588 TaxID=3114369 RepID=UPI0034CE193C
MTRVAIVTDTGAGISAAEQARLENLGGFAVVEMPVMVDDRDLSQHHLEQPPEQALILAHAMGETIRTSSPSPGAFELTYRRLQDQGFQAIVSIHLAAELSGTINAARTAARDLDIPVFVVDSRTVAMAYGHSVVKACAMASQGESAEKIAASVLEICVNTEILFTVASLEPLRRSGRIHPGIARVGQLMQIRPVATVIEGRLTYVERPRTTQRALEMLTSLTTQESQRRRAGSVDMDHALTPRPRGDIVSIQYCGDASDASRLKEQLPQSSTVGTVISPLPAVLSAHTGVGSLACVIY